MYKCFYDIDSCEMKTIIMNYGLIVNVVDTPGTYMLTFYFCGNVINMNVLI